ncbi:MAG: DEAD/DEAH box helicase, partial [Candidatus Latescibacteria bacterium]|nr:DEAD/DEAH box helicase [Candidatus Latescibacterota bacterium]
FYSFLEKPIPRRLKEHQIKAALHLLSVSNGANFSVPGSGKTTVVLTVFESLRQQWHVDALYVVGPPACFGPWRCEYQDVLGVTPSYQILAGGDVEVRRTKYLVNQESVADLYLTTFQTLQRDWEQVRELFQHQGVKFYFVVDEAHYVKQPGGAWATAVLNVADFAVRRAVLTGTPFPLGFSDAFNLFDILWPEAKPISDQDRHRIEFLANKKQYQDAQSCLNKTIGPLFYRVRKSDLGLAPQIFHPPITIPMNKFERKIYDAILDRIEYLSATDYMRDIDLLVTLRKGRMMRMRQCLSYPALLSVAVTDYNEELLDDSTSLGDIIKHYDKLETPAKVTRLVHLVHDHLQRGKKVVIWSNFVRTLEMLRDMLIPITGVRLIYGATPTERTAISDVLTRDEIIREFVDPDSGIEVLVANPAACAESISLHKACYTAVYYDLSYNCAQYLQSLDRIHRVGGSENRPADYYFLQYEDTIDSDILVNVQRKAKLMNDIVDQEYAIYSLDMFTDDDELQAYDRLFTKS